LNGFKSGKKIGLSRSGSPLPQPDPAEAVVECGWHDA
jgi:hypothetical protein